MAVAKVDVVGPMMRPDGVPDTLLQVQSYPCDPNLIKEHSSYRCGTQYYLINEELTQVTAKFAPLRHGLDLFLYRGKVYFDSFETAILVDPDVYEGTTPKDRVLKKAQYEIYLYEPIEDSVVRICRYRYID